MHANGKRETYIGRQAVTLALHPFGKPTTKDRLSPQLICIPAQDKQMRRLFLYGGSAQLGFAIHNQILNSECIQIDTEWRSPTSY